MDFDIKFYEAKNGKNYGFEFVEKELKKKNFNLYKRTVALISTLKESKAHGPPTSRSLGKGLWELKCNRGTDTCRINWCFSNKKMTILLLNGCIKKDTRRQKLEIDKARKLINEIKKFNE